MKWLAWFTFLSGFVGRSSAALNVFNTCFHGYTTLLIFHKDIRKYIQRVVVSYNVHCTNECIPSTFSFSHVTWLLTTSTHTAPELFPQTMGLSSELSIQTSKINKLKRIEKMEDRSPIKLIQVCMSSCMQVTTYQENYIVNCTCFSRTEETIQREHTRSVLKLCNVL